MKKIFVIIFMTQCYLLKANAQFEKITCESPIVASCKTENSLCYEYTDFDEDQAQSICENSDGQYQAGACEKAETVLRCMQPQNLYMPFMVFQKPMERSEAERTCEAMGGSVCE